MNPTLLAGLPTLLLAACSLTPAEVITHPPDRSEDISLGAPGGPTLRVMRVAHASVLLDFGGGVTVLTDPWFSEKVGYHHGEPLGLSIEQLPVLSAVVASHGHYDHYDLETFARYPHKDVPFFVGPQMAAAAREAGFTNVHELAEWESSSANGVTFTAAPAEHGVPEVTWLLQANSFTVFFSGDTLLTPAVRSIGDRFPQVDLALIAVNGLRAVGHQVVMTAEEAAQLVALLHARVAVPTHYRFAGSWFTDTFILGYDGTPERFVAAVAKESPSTQTRVLEPGQWLSISR